MTTQMEAILMIAQHPSLQGILNPLIDIKKDEIHWDRLGYGGLS